MQPRFIEIYDSSGAVGAFVEGGSPGDLRYPGYYQRVGRGTIHFAYPGFHKDYLLWGPWCAFLFTKVTTASPHTIQEYQP